MNQWPVQQYDEKDARFGSIVLLAVCSNQHWYDDKDYKLSRIDPFKIGTQIYQYDAVFVLSKPVKLRQKANLNGNILKETDSEIAELLQQKDLLTWIRYQKIVFGKDLNYVKSLCDIPVLTLPVPWCNLIGRGLKKTENDFVYSTKRGMKNSTMPVKPAEYKCLFCFESEWKVQCKCREMNEQADS